MLIIGLLAAIAIPTFFSQSEKARDASAKSYARAAASAIEIYATDHDGSYAGATPQDLHDIEPTVDPLVTTVTGWDGTGVPADHAYRVTSLAPTGNHFWLARSSSSTTTLGCSLPGRAGCPSDGRWG
jgi:type IV pilus assembly protein PilA